MLRELTRHPDMPVVDRQLDRPLRRPDPMVVGARVLTEEECDDGTVTRSGIITAISPHSVTFRDDDGNKWRAPREIVRVLRAAA